MVEPGAMLIPALRRPIRSALRASVRRAAPSASSFVARIAAASKRGIDRARLSDRERPDRHAGGHLDDREQAIHALQRLAFDRHAEHREAVIEAAIPGRCAAPPAPAMMTFRPRSLADDA